MGGTSAASLKEKSGLAPGSLVYVGARKTDSVNISVIDYGSAHVETTPIEDVNSCKQFKSKQSVSWINIEGLHDTKVIGSIGEQFGIHRLVLEDVLNTSHRPKLDDMGDYLFLTLKMVYLSPKNKILTEQVSLIVGQGYVLSFQEMAGDVFDALRKRINDGRGRIRKLGSDYLFYAIIDSIVDQYFIVIDHIERQLDKLDDEIIGNPPTSVLNKVHSLKKEIQHLRKMCSPLREANYSLIKSDSTIIKKETIIFLRDLQDHIVHSVDALESARDSLSGIGEYYMSLVSLQMNQVMQVLTIMASIFIPLTFIAGIYGMNFKVIPELEWEFGYAYAWALMITVVVGTLFFFRSKKWL